MSDPRSSVISGIPRRISNVNRHWLDTHGPIRSVSAGSVTRPVTGRELLEQVRVELRQIGPDAPISEAIKVAAGHGVEGSASRTGSCGPTDRVRGLPRLGGRSMHLSQEDAARQNPQR